MTAVLAFAAWWVTTAVVVTVYLARSLRARDTQVPSLEDWEADQLTGLLLYPHRAGEHYPTLVRHADAS